ncbi:hypothetical protein DFH09DRAFT_363373 [Mycena vulgaris]|nr:hypothetical protein DFH09DRAFT_363373 [Mycena vulgaris]
MHSNTSSERSEGLSTTMSAQPCPQHPEQEHHLTSSSSTPLSTSSSLGTPGKDSFSDITPSTSDEIAKALVEAARGAFEKARTRYYDGDAGPFILEGQWSEASYEALATNLESKWRLGWTAGIITIYGDPAPVHESIIESITTEVRAIEWDHHDTPESFRYIRGQLKLYRDLRSAGHKWQLTPTSSTQFMKEPDSFFRAAWPTKNLNGGLEDGLVIEIAHLNESFDLLSREVVDWTRGDGDRALLALGIKIDAKVPNQRTLVFV